MDIAEARKILDDVRDGVSTAEPGQIRRALTITGDTGCTFGSRNPDRSQVVPRNMLPSQQIPRDRLDCHPLKGHP